MTLHRRAYLDYNATAPLRDACRTAMTDAMAHGVGNASSVHAEGRAARAVIDGAREDVARLVDAKSTEVIFTSGATEAASWAVSGGWTTIYSAMIEHPAVLKPIERSGAKHVVLPVDRLGVIDVGRLRKLFRDHAGDGGKQLLAVQLANNETGVIQPLATLIGLAKEAGVTVLTDAVQAVGKQEVSFRGLGADMMLVSAHKLGGPSGVGCLVVREGMNLMSLVCGGGQERNRRGGTENVVGIAGFGMAARVVAAALPNFAKLSSWRDRIEAHVKATTPHAAVIAQDASRLVNTSCIAIPGQNGEASVIKFDLKGVSLSAGSACSSGKTAQSDTLVAMGLDDEITTSALRVSLGWATTQDDIEAFEDAWIAIMGQTKPVRNVA